MELTCIKHLYYATLFKCFMEVLSSIRNPPSASISLLIYRVLVTEVLTFLLGGCALKLHPGCFCFSFSLDAQLFLDLKSKNTTMSDI